MANIDLELSDNIAGTLSNGVIEKAGDFYRLAFFLTRDREAAVRNVKDCVSAGLFNARKIQIIPPVKTWFYQELIALCIKRGESTDSSVPAAYKGENFQKLLGLDARTMAVFALYYFEEGFGISRISKVMKLREADVKAKLSYACNELGISASGSTGNNKIFKEITEAYMSPQMPHGYKREIREVIAREKELNNKYFVRDIRNRRIRIVLGAVILAMIAYLVYTGGTGNLF